jgi:hypothetical protein
LDSDWVGLDVILRKLPKSIVFGDRWKRVQNYTKLEKLNDNCLTINCSSSTTGLTNNIKNGNAEFSANFFKTCLNPEQLYGTFQAVPTTPELKQEMRALFPSLYVFSNEL